MPLIASEEIRASFPIGIGARIFYLKASMNEHLPVQPIWERQPEEPSLWFARFLLYRNEKPARRELLEAARIYQAQASKGPYKPYKHTPGAWKVQAEQWNWKDRAEAYDKARQAEQEAREAAYREYEAAERERILTTGYALMEKRIEELSSVVDLIKGSFKLDGEIAYQWVTPDKIRELRGCLDDIAKELGHRVKKTEVTGKDGGAIEIQRNPDLATLTDDELDQLADLVSKAQERRINGGSAL